MTRKFSELVAEGKEAKERYEQYAHKPMPHQLRLLLPLPSPCRLSCRRLLFC